MKQLQKHPDAKHARPVVTIVMDGVGLAPAGESNAVYLARTPNLGSSYGEIADDPAPCAWYRGRSAV